MKATVIIVAIILFAGVWVSGFVFTPQSAESLGNDIIGEGGYTNQVINAFAGLGDKLNSVLRFFGVGSEQPTEQDNEQYWQEVSYFRYWLATKAHNITYTIYGANHTKPHLDMYPGIYAHPDYKASDFNL